MTTPPSATEDSDGPVGYRDADGHDVRPNGHRHHDTYEHEVLYEQSHLFQPLPHLALHASFSFRRLAQTSSTNGDDGSDNGEGLDDDDDYFPNHEYYATLPTESYWQHINDNSSTSLSSSVHGTLSDFGLNETEYDDFTTHLNPASDVDLEGVIAATAFNALVFAVLMISYEIMRKLVPSVYASKRQQAKMRGEEPSQDDETYAPFDWLMPVFGVSWSKVRRAGGLDAYFFLRYIRMCLRITSVSAFWAIILLWPVYGTGEGQYMPSAQLPTFSAEPVPKGKFAVKIDIDESQRDLLKAGGQGAVAIYTGHNTSLKPFRKIEIRAYTWLNWLFPMPF